MSDRERFQVSKVNGGSINESTTTIGSNISPSNITTITENVPQNNLTPTYAGAATAATTNGTSPVVRGTQTSNSRLNLRPFGSFLRRASRQEPDERKYSLAQLTSEALPRLDHYRVSLRNFKRPSIGELHGETRLEQSIAMQEPPSTESNVHGIKLGWIVGVMVPCLLNIWGVMLFLRLSWVVAMSGVMQTLIIIAISTLVCVITTLSLSAISTNGEVRGGGVYFIISRSLGPEFGASVGVVFAFANAVAASMNTIGFCDSLQDLLKSHGLKIVDGGINDVRIVGTVAIILMILICCIGMEWESKAQNFLLVTIILAIFNFIIGAAIGPRGDETAIAKGFVGLSWQTFKDNFYADYRNSEGQQQNFFSVFAIYFPSVTGIQAGANICGDLKNPGGAIPKGTLWALVISVSSYAVFVFFAGAAAVRDASGNVADLVNGTLISSQLSCRLDNTCEYGLAHSYSVMQLMSLWGGLIYAGCFAATLSTALTNILSVPRLIQALGTDKIYPGLIFFSKPYGKHGEPYRGYVLTFIVSAGFLLIGQLNVIAPLISTFYLASYALINFCTFHAAFFKPLGWRPTFKYFNAWLSLFGFALCVAIMFLIDHISALVTTVIIFALYVIVVWRKPEVNWGSTTQTQQYRVALNAVQRLQNVSDHVKNYHPKVLVISGDPRVRPPLIDFGYLLVKNNSLLFVGNVVPMQIGYKTRQNLIKEGQKYLDARKIKAFYNIIDGLSLEDGVASLIKVTGFGKMSPNIVLLGYKSDWYYCRKEEVESYFNILHNAFSQRMGVCILRLPNGLDFSYLQPEVTIGPQNISDASMPVLMNGGLGFANVLMPPANAASDLLHVDSNLNLARIDSPQTTFTIPQPAPMPNMSASKKYKLETSDAVVTYSAKDQESVPKSVMDAVTIFTRKQPKSTIDVFWLYDDGGLTMLIPYIISLRSSWQNHKLRVFALSHGKDEEMEEKNMANLLTKFRIQYSDLIMLKGLANRPKQETLDKHERLIQSFIQTAENEGGITQEELQALEEKTHRQLRIHELVVEHSSKAAVVVMSLPMPRKEAISPPLYMSWLEMLTSDISCPVVLARGNQTPVLTFYS